jgi:O-antigen/teichoic acid export membrane protein
MVAEYAVAARLFSLPTVAVAVIAAPLFPAFAEANARGDTLWLRRSARRLFFAGLIVAGIPAVVLAASGQRVVALWAGPQISPSLGLLFALAVWVVLDSVRITLATLFAATKEYRVQLLAFGVYVPLGIVARLIGARLYGLQGLVVAHIVCFVICVVTPFAWKARAVISGPAPSRTRLPSSDGVLAVESD